VTRYVLLLWQSVQAYVSEKLRRLKLQAAFRICWHKNCDAFVSFVASVLLSQAVLCCAVLCCAVLRGQNHTIMTCMACLQRHMTAV